MLPRSHAGGLKSHALTNICDVTYHQGSFPAGTPGNGVPKVILTVGTTFPGTDSPVVIRCTFCAYAAS